MAYDLETAERVRRILSSRSDVAEKRMIGGLSFLVDGSMCCGVAGNALMVRVGAQARERTLAEPHVRPMDFTGRPMRNLVYVARAGVETDADLQRWLEEAAAFVATLPARTPRRGAAPG